jgi:hypothetical protein
MVEINERPLEDQKIEKIFGMNEGRKLILAEVYTAS